MRKLLLTVASAAFFSLLTTSTSSANDVNDEASAFVEALSRAVIETVQGEDMTTQQQEAALRGLLSKGLDLAGISRFVLGHHWASATPEQRDEYQSLFSEYLLGTYTRLLQKHQVTGFTVVSTDTLDKDDIVVHTRVELANGLPMQWDWRVRDFGTHLRVTDLFSNGVSMAVTYRAEFGSVVSNNGLEALLHSLRTRAAQAHPVKNGHSAGLIAVVASLAGRGQLMALGFQN